MHYYYILALIITATAAGGTIFLGLTALGAIRQTRDIQRIERKNKILKDIVDWVISIRTVDVSIPIPITDKAFTEHERKRIETNVLYRYFLPSLTCEYIRAMVRTTFKRELESDVDNIIKNLNSFIYIRGVCSGVKDAKDAFGGTAIATVDEVEKQLIEGKLTKHQLLDVYDKLLIKCTTNLLVKVGNIIAKL